MRHSSRRSPRLAVLSGALIATLGAGCSADSKSSSPSPPRQPTADSRFGHIHGLGVDPATNDLYVASHGGISRVTNNNTIERVANYRQDTMGFAVIGPGRLLASGHPDTAGDQPPNLGLIESTDAAQTWTTRSLGGAADFHALEATDDRLYGYDAQRRTLMTRTDHREAWRGLFAAPIIDLAAHPDDSSQLLFTTPYGVQTYNGTDRPHPVGPSSDIALIDWPSPNTVAAITASGNVLVSTDEARTWTQTATLAGDVQALDATGGTWFAATSAAIYASEDQGRSWTTHLETDS